MKDIEKIAVECGFLTLGDTNKVYRLDQIETFAKALQGVVEPVGWQVYDEKYDDWFPHINDMSTLTEIGKKDWRTRFLYTSPSNTQARLDKAIEAISKAIKETTDLHEDEHKKSLFGRLMHISTILNLTLKELE